MASEFERPSEELLTSLPDAARDTDPRLGSLSLACCARSSAVHDLDLRRYDGTYAGVAGSMLVGPLRRNVEVEK